VELWRYFALVPTHALSPTEEFTRERLSMSNSIYSVYASSTMSVFLCLALSAYAPHLIRLPGTRENQPTWQVPKNVHSAPLTRECSFISRRSSSRDLAVGDSFVNHAPLCAGLGPRSFGGLAMLWMCSRPVKVPKWWFGAPYRSLANCPKSNISVWALFWIFRFALI